MLHHLGQRLARRGEDDLVTATKDDTVEGRQERVLATLNEPHRDVRKRLEHAGDGPLTDEYASRPHLDLREELFAAALDQRLHGRGAIGQNPRRHERDVNEPGRRQDQPRNREVEETDPGKAETHRRAGHQEIRARADERRHAAEDGGVAERNHDPAGRATHALGQRGHDGDEDDHHRGVVEDRAQENHRQQRQPDRRRRVMATQHDEATDGVVERAGPNHALANHQQPENGD